MTTQSQRARRLPRGAPVGRGASVCAAGGWLVHVPHRASRAPHLPVPGRRAAGRVAKGDVNHAPSGQMGDVLVERDPFLAPLLEWVPARATRSGRLVLLGGEAGVGKTSLVALLAHAGAAGGQGAAGFCDNVATPAPLGPVLEALPRARGLARGRRGRDPAAAVPPGARRGWPTSRRCWCSRTCTGPTRRRWSWSGSSAAASTACRCSASPPSATTRSARATRSPRLLGDLATAPGVGRMHLPALSADAVADARRGRRPRARPDALHRRTGGNPFFVTEVLAAGTTDVPADGARRGAGPGGAPVSGPARDVLDAAAVLGPAPTLPLLGEVAGQPPRRSTSASTTGCWSPTRAVRVRVPSRDRPRDGRGEPLGRRAHPPPRRAPWLP